MLHLTLRLWQPTQAVEARLRLDSDCMLLLWFTSAVNEADAHQVFMPLAECQEMKSNVSVSVAYERRG